MNITPRHAFKIAFAAAAGFGAWSAISTAGKMLIFLAIRGIMGGY
jgi:hypothetical protein